MIVAFIALLTVLFLLGIGAWAQDLEGQRKMEIDRISQTPKSIIRFK